MFEKGVFHYEYESDDSRLMESKLPEKKNYTELQKESISDDDFNFAWKLFNTAK